jgi:hypothetical protein
MTEVITFTYGQKSATLPLSDLTPGVVAKTFNANFAELFLIDSKQKLITIENEKFDAELTAGESYKVCDGRQQIDGAVVSALANIHVSSFKNALQQLYPTENISDNLKLQGIALVTMNVPDISLKEGNYYKHVKNTKSLRAAVHDLTANATKTFLETSSCAGEIHSGMSNILKGVPDMLKEIDNPNSESEEILEGLETWMKETLQECYDQSEAGAQQTENLLDHVQELERALIASYGVGGTETNDSEKNIEKLELLKRQQKRFEKAKLEAKNEIDKAWESKRISENAEEEYDTARNRRNQKIGEIFDLEHKIEQSKKNEATNEDVLKVIQNCIEEINEVKQNWSNATSSICELKNILEVEKDAQRWKNSTKSLKIDSNKRYLIENMLQFLAVGYKVDYWMDLQNQMIVNHLLPIASSANNVFGGDQSASVDEFQMTQQATALVKRKQIETIKEYEADLQECLSLNCVATIFQSDSDLYKI